MDIENKSQMESDIEMNVQNWRGLRLARAYMPVQTFTRKFEPFEALQRGTLFPELYQPYRARER